MTTPGLIKCELLRPVLWLLILYGNGCSQPKAEFFQGYAEGEFVYVASPLSGALESLKVKRGDQVKEGDSLFSLEDEPERDARDEADRRLAQAVANLEDARKGKRPSELTSLEAQLNQAQAALELGEKELTRQEQLRKTAGATTQQEVDRARSTRDQQRQRVAQLEADLKTGRLGLREDQIAAAEANVRALKAALAKADWDLDQKRQAAPQAGFVFDTLYREGEWVGPGKPVVVLLPPENIKVRTFVPQAELSRIQQGTAVQVRVDGNVEVLTGKVTYISPRAEYTPPVIYSRESRSKLVFMIEAEFAPDVAVRLHPGQPVEVHFER